MKRMILWLMLMVSVTLGADQLRYEGAGRIEALDLRVMELRVNKKSYSLNPYKLEAFFEKAEIPIPLLKAGQWIRFYSNEERLVQKIEVLKDVQLKDKLKER